MNGGTAVQITNYPDAVDGPYCSPADKNLLIFLKANSGDGQYQIYLMDRLTQQVERLSQTVEARYSFGGWSRDGASIAYSSNERNGKDFDVYMMNIRTREVVCVCQDGGRWFSSGFSPLGTILVLSHESSNLNNDLYLHNLRSGTRDHITPHDGVAHFGAPQWLPDESVLFVIANPQRDFTALFRYTLANKKCEIAYAPSWDVVNTRISKDGKHLAVCVNEDGYRKAVFFELVGLQLKPLPHSLKLEHVYPVGFSKSGNFVACVCSGSRRTANIYLIDVRTGEANCVVESSQKVLPEVLVEPELVHTPSFDGLSIPLFVYQPKHAAGKVPAIMYIHGGPESQFVPVFVPQIQFLVSQGYAVIAPNIRGSTGYGTAYVSLDDRDKRFDAIRDVVTVREYVTGRDDIDGDKIIVMGDSYGGFMVLACLAFYPNLWAAGVDIVGIANFVTFLQNTAPYRRALREAEYGSLEHDRALLESLSPINKAQDIQAPLLMIHGSNDPRVPLSEAESIQERIRQHGGVAELVVYPDEGHGLSKRHNRIDAFGRIVEFLERVL